MYTKVLMSQLVSTRIEENISREIMKLAKEKNIGKTALLRELITKGLADLKLDLALDLYRKGKITLWKASELAQINLWQFLEEVKKHKIPLHYTLEDAKEDIRQAFGQ